MFNDLIDRARRDGKTARTLKDMGLICANAGRADGALEAADRVSRLRTELRKEAETLLDINPDIVDDVMAEFNAAMEV